MSERILLVANNFPPVVGGSASVYANLAACEPLRLLVLAPRRNYANGAPIEGWEAHDRAAPNQIIRLPLLRTVIPALPPTGAERVRFLAGDLAIRTRVLVRILWLVVFRRVRTVCLGELLASGWMARALRFLPGVSVAVYIHGEEITTTDSYDPVHRRARQAIMDCDTIVVVSSFTLQAVRTLLGPAVNKRIVMIQNGVNKATFFADSKSPTLLARYPSLAGHLTFVSVCRLVEKKGIDQALRAFHQVSRELPEARFLVVGAGAQESRLREIALEADQPDRIIFTGQVAAGELADHYRLGDIFVMPNRRMPDGDTEGFGLVFLEANRCGLPVIAGCDGGSTDAVTDGDNGLIVDGQSVPQIAAAMLRLAREPNLYARLQAGGLRRSNLAGWETKAQMFVAAMLSPARHARVTAEAPTPIGFYALWLVFLPFFLATLPWLLFLRLKSALSATR